MTEYSNSSNNGIVSSGGLNCAALKDLCTNNANHFEKDATENGRKLHNSFLEIIEAVESIWLSFTKIGAVVTKYDFDERTPGNGYRSFLICADAAVAFALQFTKKICLRRDSLLFRKAVMVREMESCAEILKTLSKCLMNLEQILEVEPKELFLLEYKDNMDEFHQKFLNLDVTCIYGRHLGFQFCESIRPALRFVDLSMVLFSEVYYSSGSLFSKATNSVTSTAKFLSDPETRAKRLVNITRYADVGFVKSFWFLSESELMNQVPSVAGDNVAISTIIRIPSEPLLVATASGKEIELPAPTCYIGEKAIQGRLISSEYREGMADKGKAKTPAKPPSRALLLHCHGGGFIAQSSRSHELYLRQWAKIIDIPILSIDYSLAPEAPYPRAHEEILYAYCWAMKNACLLGSTGERIIVAGDSAGGNLLLGMVLKCITMDIPLPHGLFLAYTPTWIEMIGSPSRLLSIFDPLIPFGFLIRCMLAYAIPSPSLDCSSPRGSPSGSESFEEISQSDLAELEAHKSVASNTSDTITCESLNSPSLAEKDEEMPKDETKARANGYLTEMFGTYVFDADNEMNSTSRSDLMSQASENTLQTKISSFVNRISSQIGHWVGASRTSSASAILDTDRDAAYRSVIQTLNIKINSDMYLSPYLATDEVLKKLPPVRILTLHLDPCLDDGVAFAKRLKSLGNDIHLDVLNGLPHGFLNLTLYSKEAYDGSKLCAQRISELLMEE